MAIIVEKYYAEQIDATVSLLADAFVTNPLHVSAFGPQRIDQNRLFFRIGLRHMFNGQAFVAIANGEIEATRISKSPLTAFRRRRRFRSRQQHC